MKYILSNGAPLTFWNGEKSLPNEINVIHHHPQMAEFELLSIICTLHGHVTAFDILTGAETGTEKDTDLTAVMTAFQRYLSPKMPLSNYTGTDKRAKPNSEKKIIPIDARE
jgi:hypothetical protein